jgi:hypothetical protein
MEPGQVDTDKRAQMVPVTTPTDLGLTHTRGPHLIEIVVTKVGDEWKIVYREGGVISPICKAKRKERVEWKCNQLWAVNFYPKTPFADKNGKVWKIWNDAGKKAGAVIQAKADLGPHKYFVAVLINDPEGQQLRILTDDPEVDVEEEDDGNT